MKCHKDMKSIEARKLTIEEDRLEMDKASMIMKQRQIEVQTNLE